MTCDFGMSVLGDLVVPSTGSLIFLGLLEEAVMLTASLPFLGLLMKETVLLAAPILVLLLVIVLVHMIRLEIHTVVVKHRCTRSIHRWWQHIFLMTAHMGSSGIAFDWWHR